MDRPINLTDKNGFYKIIAIDHRDSLKKILEEKDISRFKTLAALEFAPYASAILLDRTYGHQARLLARSVNLSVIWTAEKTGYLDTDFGRKTELYEDFNPLFEKENYHIDCVKILIYYNRESKNAKEQVNIAKEVYEKCKMANLPLLIEPITYPITGIEYNKSKAILEAVFDLQFFADILKLEFPVDVSREFALKDLEKSEMALAEINKSCLKPWILLSRGMEFHLFKESLKLCKKHGAKGYAVGRAVWQEIENYKTWEEKSNFIKTIAKDRMKELDEIF